MDILNLNLPTPPLSNPQNLLSQKQVRPPRIKPVFPKTVLWKWKKLSSITKYRYKGLSAIQLLCATSYEANPNNLRVIYKSLKETKRLLSLAIVTSEVGALNLEQLPYFLNATSRLKRLSVTFDHATYGADIPLKKNAEEMLTRFRRFRDLSYLDVSFDTPDEITNRILIRLLKQLKGLTKLRKLFLNLVGCEDVDESLDEDYEPNALIFTSQYPRCLRSLCINFQSSNLPHIEMLPKFASNLSCCNSLEFLGLDCSRLSSQWNFLFPIFQMTKSLKSLLVTRDFSLQTEIYESQQFATSLEYLKHLTALELQIDISLPEDPSKEFVKSLFKHLSSLTNLESLSLEFDLKRFPSNDDSDFQDLLLNIKSLSRLQTFDLSLYCHADATTIPLQSLFQAFQSVSCLRKFQLNLPCQHKISHQDIVALSLMLKNLNCLKNLELAFNDTEVGSESLEILVASIAHFQLSSLDLDVRQKGPLYLIKSKKTLGKDTKGVNLLFSTLSNFTSLWSLDLNLTNLDFPATELKELSLSLKKLKNLTCLSLKFGPQGQGPRFILPCLRKIPKLVYLKLICLGALGNDTVQLLASSLMDCRKSLKSLHLQFRLNNKTQNIPLQALEKGLEALVSLKNLTIKIKRMNMFKSREVFKVLGVLGLLKKLEEVDIELPFQVSPKGFDYLREKMKGHWNLKTFNVNSLDVV